MASAYKRGKQMGEAIVNMVDQLTMPGDREPFMDAMRKEVAAWFRKYHHEKKGTMTPVGTQSPPRAFQKSPKTADSSLRSINQALKGNGRRRKSSKKP